MIEILTFYPRTELGHDPATLAADIEEMAARGGHAALVKCSSLTCGDALVLYAGAPDGDGVFTGPALAAELEAALLAEVEGC